MSKVTSTISGNAFIFDSSIMESTTIKDEISKIDLSNEVNLVSQFRDKSSEFLSEVNKLIHSTEPHNEVNFNEIELTYENFHLHHYDIFKYKLIIVLYDDGIYKYITPGGNIYFTNNKKVISIIHSSPQTHKLTYTTIPLLSNEYIISFSAIHNVLFNMNNIPLNKALEHYLTSICSLDITNDYLALYQLLNIFPKIQRLINKFLLWKYFNLENSIYFILNSTRYYYSIDTTLFNTIKKSLEDKIGVLCQSLNLPVDVLSTKEELLNYIQNNISIYPTINLDVLSSLELNDYYELITLLETLNSLTQYIKSGFNINSHTNIGIIKSTPLYFNITNKRMIKATYTDLFFRCLVDISYDKELINLCDSEIPFLDKLFIYNDVKKDNPFIRSCISVYIQELLKGNSSTSDMIKAFRDRNIIIKNDGIKSLQNIYENELINLKNVIDKFNSLNYSTFNFTVINHNISTSKFYTAINDRIRLITKNLINELNLYCIDFNKKNKEKIYLYNADFDSVYIICDEGAENVALDTITRIMPTIFNKYCPKLIPTCKIDLIE